MSELPAVLKVESLGDGRWSAPHPADDPEGRDVVFSGQVLAQMIMASDAAVESQKEVKSIHAIFARAGTYSAGLMELQLEPMHSGRAWGSDTITAYQGDRLLSRGLVLLNTVEPDLMRHSPAMPDVPGPDDSTPAPSIIVFPGAEARLRRPARRGRRRRIPRDVLLDAHPGVVRLGRGQPGRRGVEPTGLHHRVGHAAPFRHRQHRRRAPLDLDRRHLAHRPLPRPRRRRPVDARRAARRATRGTVGSSGRARCSRRTGSSCRPSRRTAWRAVSRARSIPSAACSAPDVPRRHVAAFDVGVQFHPQRGRPAIRCRR